jgi:hypothetical protein
MLDTKLLKPARLIAIALIIGCSDSTDPSTTSVAGAYTATTFTSTQTTTNTTTNHLSEGASLVIVLASAGTTTGALVIPTDGVDESMAGTWSLSGSTVSFLQAADTFMNDMDFVVQGNTLVGDQTFAGTRIQVTLTRQ